MGSIQTAQQTALQIIAQNPQGIRFKDLLNQVSNVHPTIPSNTIVGALGSITKAFPGQIVKPATGLYAPSTASTATASSVVSTPPPSPAPLAEKHFYQPFADYLKAYTEAVEAEELGGAGLGQKWGTPDVVAVYKSQATDRIKFPLEVHSAEVKINWSEPLTAFGQAAAYRLFSSKSYVVMPSPTQTQTEASRLEALCSLFGIGYITFDATNVASPNFDTVIQAQRSIPDMRYVNGFADALHQHNPTLFKKLF